MSESAFSQPKTEEVHTAQQAAGSPSHKRPPLHRRVSAINGLTVRPFEEEDTKEVREIIYSYIRSQIRPAVRFWFFRNFSHLIALAVLVKLFVSWAQLGIVCLCFYCYLLFRSWWEYESYIKHDCDDLKDIQRTYMEDSSKQFWVAEMPENIGQRPAKATGNPPIAGKKRIAGCIAYGPSKDDPSKVGKILRLVVSEKARRYGVGSQLLEVLEEMARQRGNREVRMNTTNLFPEVLYFYKKNGYEVLHSTRRGLMRGDLICYRKIMESKSGRDTPQLLSALPSIAHLDSKLPNEA